MRFKSTSYDQKQQSGSSTGVFNVHTNCLKEIEELNFQAPASTASAASQPEQAKVMEKMEVPVSIVGQKRTYVDATQVPGKDTVGSGKGHQMDFGGAVASDQQLKGLQDIIRGLESQKRRRTD